MERLHKNLWFDLYRKHLISWGTFSYDNASQESKELFSLIINIDQIIICHYFH